MGEWEGGLHDEGQPPQQQQQQQTIPKKEKKFEQKGSKEVWVEKVFHICYEQ